MVLNIIAIDTMNPKDNIGGPVVDATPEQIPKPIDAQPNAQPAIPAAGTHPDLDTLADECMKGFEQLDAMDVTIREQMNRIKTGQDDQSRLRLAIATIEALQKRNELNYNLLVSMNNFYGSK